MDSKKIDQLRQQLLNLWNKKHPDQPIPTSVREWVERMGIKAEMTQLRNELAQAEAELVTTKEKEAYLRISEAVARKIQIIMQAATVEKPQENLEWYEFPSHPVLNRWGEVEETINKAINDLNFELSDKKDLEQKITTIFEAKRKLAKQQADYTNLFLKTTIKYMPGGYDGWNEAEEELTSLLESFPYSAARLKELDCVGRTILLSAMLMAAEVFEEEDLVTMSTYRHILLGGVDVFNVLRAIEGSGYPIHSYYYYSTYGNKDSRNKIFYGEVFGEKEIICQLPVSVGLLASLGNTYSRCLEKSEVKVLLLLLKLLQTSGYIEDLLWYRLSNFCQSYTDRLLCLSRATSINHFYLGPLVKLYNLFDKNKDEILADLRKNRASPLLKYIKLNLLIIQKALYTVFQFKPEFYENIDGIKSVLIVLELLFNLNLENIQIPSFWQKKYGPNLERATIKQIRTDLSNQNLFPKPISFNNEGRIIWQMPD